MTNLYKFAGVLLRHTIYSCAEVEKSATFKEFIPERWKHIYALRWSRGSVLVFGTQVRGFKPDRSRRIFQDEKNPQHAFLRKGSKAVCHMW